MKINFILFAVIPFVLMGAVCVLMPFWRLRLIKEAGEKILPLAKKRSKIQIVAIPAAYILLILSIMVDFGKMNFVIPYCAVLALFISIKESTLLPVNGVYETLLINGSDVVRFKDITALPDSADSLQNNVLKIVTKHGPRQLAFDNSNEAEEVRKMLTVKCESL